MLERYPIDLPYLPNLKRVNTISFLLLDGPHIINDIVLISHNLSAYCVFLFNFYKVKK